MKCLNISVITTQIACNMYAYEFKPYSADYNICTALVFQINGIIAEELNLGAGKKGKRKKTNKPQRSLVHIESSLNRLLFLFPGYDLDDSQD